ncbi:MAG: hypothetical protein U0U46_04675 [Saprospiraceae bacterium]
MKNSIVPIILLLLLACGTMAPAQDVQSAFKQKPLSFSGSIGVGTQFYGVSGIPARSVNPMWNLSGSAALRLYGLDIPFAFTVGRQGARADGPSFGQIGISPRYKWLTVHGGWRSLQFSSYTLAGHTFLGGGVELRPGKFRFGAVYGRFRKARETGSADANVFYPTAYRRTGYALKIGVGTDRSFFDLLYFRAKDDAQSLQNTAAADSLGVTPGENAVLGFNTRLRLGRSVSFFSEGATSLYTRDLRSANVEETNTAEAPHFFLVPKLSTRLNYAVRGGLDFTFRPVQLKLAYERILPEFATMGAYFFANDVENITVSPTFNLWQNKVRLSGMLGVQRNNLLHNRSETTRRLIGNANLSANISQQFGFDVNYMNLAVRQRDGRVLLDDTIRVAMVTTNVSVTPRWSHTDAHSVKNLLFLGNYQQLNDKNPYTREFTDMTTWLSGLTFTQGFLQSGWNWNAGVNWNRIELAALTTDRYGLALGLGRTTTDGKFSYQLSGNGSLSRIERQKDGSVWSGSFSLGYTPAAKHTFSLNINVLKNVSAQFDDFTEWSGGVTYFYLL